MQVNQYVNMAARMETSGDEKRISGYASVFFDGTSETEAYVPDVDAYERIAPSAFDESIRNGDVVESRFNHNSERILGRTDLGTLELSIDKRGLKYSVKFDADDPDHQTVEAKINSGLINGSSFIAVIRDWDVSEVGDKMVITYTRMELIEAGPVIDPAMTGTGIPIVSMSKDEDNLMADEIKRWKETKQRIAEWNK